MRCKAGDIAVCVRGYNIGKLVSVEAHYMGGKVGGVVWVSAPSAWIVKSISGSLLCKDQHGREWYSEVKVMDDALLRPLRDRPGEDETFEWAKKPCLEPSQRAL